MTERPVPVSDRTSAPFWEAARERRLVIQYCPDCEAFQHPPNPICRRCARKELRFEQVSGRGVLYTFTVSYQPFVPGFEDWVPLPVALVELEEQQGLRLLTNVLGASPDTLHVGMAMHVVFDDVGDGLVLPQFRPVEIEAIGNG